MLSLPRPFLCVVSLLAAGWMLRAEPKQSPNGGTYEVLEFKVLKSYLANDGGYLFRAYVIEWNGQEVIARDVLAETEARSDDTISVMVHKSPFPRGAEPYGLLGFSVMSTRKDRNRDSFAPEAPPGEAVPGQGWEVVPLKVRKVYAMEDNGHRFRSYLVEWAGQEVIVSDTLAKTSYKEGDLMRTLVMKHPFPNGKKPTGLLNFAAEPPPRARASFR